MIELGTFATGILTGLGASALIATLFTRFLEQGIVNVFKKIQQSRDIVGQAEIQYRQQQLSEFYGPLYAYLKGSKTLHRLWMAGKLPDINEEVKANFREQNQAMLNVIRTKAHLIDEEAFPDELALFMTSVTIWTLYTSQQGAVPEEVAQLPETKFPEEFSRYIYKKTKDLKIDLERLYRKYGIK